MTEKSLVEQLEERVAQIPSGFFTTQEIESERRKICLSCDKHKEVASVEICDQCGCFIAFKAKLQVSYCPLQKWTQ